MNMPRKETSANATLKAAATGTSVVARSFPTMIDQLKKQVQLAAPRHLSADRMARIALTEFHKNPQLGECDPVTVFASVVIAAQLGLEPGVLGQGYLIPYKNNCTFVPGWRGLVDIANRSGRSSVWTGAVFEGDEFEYTLGSSPALKHVPCGEDDFKKLTHVYAVGRIRGAEYPVIEVWPIAKVFRHRDRFNKVGQRHYSYAHPEMYARKVVLLQALKYMPASVEVAAALQLATDLNNAADSGSQRLDLTEAINGVFSAPIEAATEEAPTETPDLAAVVARLRAAPTIEDLSNEWEAVKQAYMRSKAEVPIDVEAAKNERADYLRGDVDKATKKEG